MKQNIFLQLPQSTPKNHQVSPPISFPIQIKSLSSQSEQEKEFSARTLDYRQLNYNFWSRSRVSCIDFIKFDVDDEKGLKRGDTTKIVHQRGSCSGLIVTEAPGVRKTENFHPEEVARPPSSRLQSMLIPKAIKIASPSRRKFLNERSFIDPN